MFNVAGLWPGGAAFVHGEGRWKEGTNSDVGSLLPANSDTVMPSATGSGDPNWAVSEWHLLQALPGNLLAAVGKIDMAAWADTNPFANRERCARSTGPSTASQASTTPTAEASLGRSSSRKAHRKTRRPSQ